MSDKLHIMRKYLLMSDRLRTIEKYWLTSDRGECGTKAISVGPLDKTSCSRKLLTPVGKIHLTSGWKQKHWMVIDKRSSAVRWNKSQTQYSFSYNVFESWLPFGFHIAKASGKTHNIQRVDSSLYGYYYISLSLHGNSSSKVSWVRKFGSTLLKRGHTRKETVQTVYLCRMQFNPVGYLFSCYFILAWKFLWKQQHWLSMMVISFGCVYRWFVNYPVYTPMYHLVS